jgi:hypothetical protein
MIMIAIFDEYLVGIKLRFAPVESDDEPGGTWMYSSDAGDDFSVWGGIGLSWQALILI